MKVKLKKEFFSVISLIVFAILAVGSFESDENSKEYKEAKEKLEKEGFFEYKETIIPEEIAGIWEQYKFVNKQTDKTIHGALTEMDGKSSVIIFKSNNDIFVGSVDNNLKVGTYYIENSKLYIKYNDGKETYYFLLNLSDGELIYFIEEKSDFIYYYKKIQK